MTKDQALHAFWSRFGVPAIDEVSAYDPLIIKELNITYPYITYEVATSSFDEPVALSADLWDKSTSWSVASAKAAEIESALSAGGLMLPYDGGAVWITRGVPFAQRADAENDYDIRRIHISINAEFLSA